MKRPQVFAMLLGALFVIGANQADAQDIFITNGPSTYEQEETDSNSADLDTFIGTFDGLFEDSWLVRYVDGDGTIVSRRLVVEGANDNLERTISQSGNMATVTYSVTGSPGNPFDPPVDLFNVEFEYVVSTDGDGNAILDTSFTVTSDNVSGDLSLLNYFDVSMEGFGQDNINTSAIPTGEAGFYAEMQSQNGNFAYRTGVDATRFGSRAWNGGVGGNNLDDDFLAGGDMTNIDEGQGIDITAAFQWDFNVTGSGQVFVGSSRMQVGQLQAIPEPGTGFVLASLGLMGLTFRRRRR